MIRSAGLALLSLALVALPSGAAAQVELKITGGRVWLAATNATVGQILDEWARIGGTQIVNGDRVPGGPVTLQLDNVSEQEALDVLLKSAAGFMAVRKPAAAPATSAFGRIFILPTSTVVQTMGSAPASPAPEPVVEEPAAQEPVFTPSEPPVFTPVQPGFGPQPPVYAPGVQPVLGPDGQPIPDDQQDAPPQPRPVPLPPGFSPIDPNAPPAPPAPPAGPNTSPQTPAPTTPVGVPRPGMIVPPPQPTREEDQR
jgi:hypothetical protein